MYGKIAGVRERPGGHIPTSMKRLSARIALIGLRLMARAKNLTLKAAKTLAPVLQPVYRTAVRFLILPLYKLLMLIRLRMNRVAIGARGFLFFLLTNRYVFHVILIAISAAAITSQLQAKSATALEAGQNSLLYTLATNGQDAYVEEQVRPELIVKDSHYLDADTLEPAQNIDDDYALDPNIAVVDTAVPGSIALMPNAETTAAQGQPIAVKRTKTESYTVQDGDTISTIAAKFGVTANTILWANNLSSNSTIRPSQTLRIPPQSGLLYAVKQGDTLSSIAKKYDVSTDDILSANQMTDASSLALGEELVLPGATPPTVSAPVAVRTGATIAGKKYDVYQELDSANDTRSIPQDKEDVVPTTQLLWPTDSHRINQYFGWKHTGVDIHGTYTNAIYAAADGVVEFAGWNSGGYGEMILINNGGGMKTRYAHSSKLLVKKGDVVKRGQVIGMIGTTGRSTGPHLHFEVIINGKYQNPLAYTK